MKKAKTLLGLLMISGLLITGCDKEDNKIVNNNKTNDVNENNENGNNSDSGNENNSEENNESGNSGENNNGSENSGSEGGNENQSGNEGGNEGGNGNDVYNINGKYGVFKGGSGYNIFTTAEAKDVEDPSGYNVVFGGLGTNAYNDYGMNNMYQGAYALYQGTAYSGVNGYDTVRMNGYYGIARTDASKLAEGYDPSVYFTGYMNAFFTGESATVDGVTINYHDILNGTYANCNKSFEPVWTMRNFYGSNYSPTGYSAAYSSLLLSKVFDE